MLEVLTPLAVIALLIVLNGVFVAAEFAIVGSRPSRLDEAGRPGSWPVRYVKRILASPANQDRYIAIAQLGITLATIGLGMYGEPSIAGWIYGPIERVLGISEPVAHTVGTIIAVVVMTYFHVVVGEMIPKSLALQTPERTALGVSQAMRVTGIVFYPLVRLLNGVATALLRLLRIPVAEGASRLYTAEEIAYLAEESQHEGAISAGEQQLINNIFDFGELAAHDVMKPRLGAVGVPLNAAAGDIDALIEEQHYSRYPVFDGSLDRVIGVLHVKDFIKQQAEGRPFELRRLLRRAPRVPESMPADRLLAALKRLQVHMAIVTDEYGGTSGIVTMEDLVEQVVGDVEDEYDDPDVPDIEVLDERRALVAGDYAIRDFNREFDLDLKANGVETLAGLVLEALKRAPDVGDEAEVGPLHFRVAEIAGLAIKKLEVIFPEATFKDATQDAGKEARKDAAPSASRADS